MTVVASDVFPSIHALLTRSGLKKAAAALAKEAKLQPKAFESQHDLVEVFSFYMKQHNGIKSKGDAVPILKDGAVKKVQKKKKKKEDSIEAEDEKQVVVKKGPVSSSKKEKVLVQGEKKSSKKGAEKKKKGSKKAVAEKKEVESSSSDSSDSSDEEVGETKTARSKKAADKVKTKAKEEDSSDSDDKVQSNTLKRKIEASSAAKNVKKAKRDADSSSNDSSSSDDDSSDSSDSSDFSDSSDDEEARTKETARRDEAAKAALEWQPKKMEKVATKAKSAGTPFQRVDGEFWSQKIVNDTLRDNSYEGTFGTDGVGVKANTKLLKTRGKDFTKGKNKLKRSTYMCGAISMASNSFKFDE